MKIFVPVDGSEQSLRALDYLKIQSLLPWENPEVEVFYAILPSRVAFMRMKLRKSYTATTSKKLLASLMT